MDVPRMLECPVSYFSTSTYLFCSHSTLRGGQHFLCAQDMTMREDFSLDALYFHYPNTLVQVLAGTAILCALDGALFLDIPALWTPVASLAFALAHNVLWNTMHVDMHEVRGAWRRRSYVLAPAHLLRLSVHVTFLLAVSRAWLSGLAYGQNCCCAAARACGSA